MSIPPNGATGIGRLIWLRFYNVQKWQITFTLGLDADKNTDYIKKWFM